MLMLVDITNLAQAVPLSLHNICADADKTLHDSRLPEASRGHESCSFRHDRELCHGIDYRKRFLQLALQYGQLLQPGRPTLLCYLAQCIQQFVRGAEPTNPPCLEL
jgi:hypothetical protein